MRPRRKHLRPEKKRAGVQLTSTLNYNILALPRHKFRIGAGPVFRYESSSYPDTWGYSLTNDNFSPNPAYYFIYTGKQHQFAIGYNVGVSYFAAITRKLQLGIRASFQNDTEGATITHLGLSIGRFVHLSRAD